MLILAISVVWPLYARASYVRRRTWALALLRVALLGMPFHCSGSVIEVMSAGQQAVATGMLTPLFTAYTFLNSTRVIVLFMVALAWRLPLPVHLAVHTATIGGYMRYAVGPYCSSKVRPLRLRPPCRELSFCCACGCAHSCAVAAVFLANSCSAVHVVCCSQVSRGGRARRPGFPDRYLHRARRSGSVEPHG